MTNSTKKAAERSDVVEDVRFLMMSDVAGMLSTSVPQVYALVRRGELPAIKLGGRGQWRIEATVLEDFIQAMYRRTERFIAEHPFPDSGLADDEISS